jgi:hypothetical protein
MLNGKRLADQIIGMVFINLYLDERRFAFGESKHSGLM